MKNPQKKILADKIVNIAQALSSAYHIWCPVEILKAKLKTFINKL